ncbi:MAG: tRNA pseudouridine(55) synthase TruB [Bacilli bacterium]|nr:tRNA pseudouridine(55) synthase TruB [Bacilli bacterium]
MKYTTLVNKDNKIKDSFIKKINLINTKNELNEDIQVEEYAYNNFLSLKEYLKELNIYIDIDDSYRSINTQEEIYNKYLNLNGQEYCDNYVAVPSFSEHHTGLAIDIMLKVNNSFLREDMDQFAYIDTFEEIHKHLYKYGFILRYPKGKEKITGYSYEPWHFRYVGKFIAKIIYENNLTLEEYLKDYGTVLYINKTKGVTSFDVVNEISKKFGIKRVGHTGTLDPLATGVLIVTVGTACKVVELLTSHDKEYIATVDLGYSTDTLDIEGKVLEKKDVPNDLNIEEVLNSFKKTYLQEVPIYSAVKVNGKKLYEYARNNIDVELPKKEVTIKEIELLEKNNNSFKFKCLVTKGCYIRSLIKDIGIKLNTLATMTELIRTKQGNISIEETDSIDTDFTLHSITDALNYDILVVDDLLEKKISNGMKINNDFNINDKVIFINKSNKLLGIYEKEDNYLKVWKNFV